MGNFLFLEGNSGEGKTTLLFECLNPLKSITAGFYSQRLIDDKGETQGFRLVPAEEDWIPRMRYRNGLSNMFIERTNTGWKKRLEFFEKEGADILHSAKGKKLCLMDEIGGVELFAPGFMKAVFDCVDGFVPCIGVLKSRNNFLSMSERVPVRPEADRLLEKLKEELTSRPCGRILKFERDEEDSIRLEIIRFLNDNLEEWAGGKT